MLYNYPQGYGGSTQPKEVAAYDMRLLARDVVRVATVLGSPKFRLVAHDFGCIVAWQVECGVYLLRI